MKSKLLLLSYVAAGALALAAPASKAASIAPALHLDNDVTQAHAVRICDEDGDCWMSYKHRHRGEWDEDRDRGWRHGYREHDEDRYGRAPHHGRDYDNDRERHGRDWDRDRDRGEWGRAPEHERRGTEDNKDRDRDRSADQGTKERGESKK